MYLFQPKKKHSKVRDRWLIAAYIFLIMNLFHISGLLLEHMKLTKFLIQLEATHIAHQWEKK